MRIAQPIELSEKEIKTLTSWSRGHRTPTRLMKRAKIVLMAAQGQQDKTIAELLGSTHGKGRAGADGLLSNGWWELKGMLRGVAETLRSENEWLL